MLFCINSIPYSFSKILTYTIFNHSVHIAPSSDSNDTITSINSYYLISFATHEYIYGLKNMSLVFITNPKILPLSIVSIKMRGHDHIVILNSTTDEQLYLDIIRGHNDSRGNNIRQVLEYCLIITFF